jgi:hypothetical protein
VRSRPAIWRCLDMRTGSGVRESNYVSNAEDSRENRQSAFAFK